MAQAQPGEGVLGPIGSKAAANLFRDGVDFNLQVVLLKNCIKLTCYCMKSDTVSSWQVSRHTSHSLNFTLHLSRV